MSARKLSVLMNRHDSNAARDKRTAAEKSMTPREPLQLAPPARLKGHKIASGLWKKIVTLYFSVEGQIATAFDEEILINFCLLREECDWLDEIRGKVGGEFIAIEKMISKKPSANDEAKMKNYLKLLEQYGAILARLQGIDARLDGKRKLTHSMAQSLYLTPRSRAGVAPPVKEQVKEMDPMEALLSEIDLTP